MPVSIDLTGKRFNRWTVLRFMAVESGKSRWLCRCDCGAERKVAGTMLTRNRSKSCGCWRAEAMGNTARRHGKTYSPTWKSWQAMHARCNYQCVNGYERYGGRGISVCERWKVFENFLADMGERPEGMTLDRIDSNRNYEPGNCKWSTRSEQQRNRRPWRRRTRAEIALSKAAEHGCYIPDANE